MTTSDTTQAQLEAHGVFVGFLLAVALLCAILAIAAVLEVRRDRRRRKARQAAPRPPRPRRESASERHHRLDQEAAQAAADRAAGIEEGFRRGWHG